MFGFLPVSPTRKPAIHAGVRRRRAVLRVELLEGRTLLSTSLPLNPITWTPLGPAPVNSGGNHSTGRISAVAADPNNANTLYVATAGGGVWKTTSGGVHWTPLTDTQDSLYMGAIALAPSDPLTIYAGTGEANYGPSKIALRRENVFAGRGVLKSTNGGATWSLLGSDVFYRRTISRIVVDPTDADTVYAAVGFQAYDGLPGNTGVWKSTDGGQTWNLMVNGIGQFTDNDAVSDLVMDPSNPEHLYAAVGNPNGSPANGVYQTFDGGASWLLAGNFPTGAIDPLIGRITLAISASSPTTLFAAIAQAGSNAVFKDMYKTTDGGSAWARLSGVPSYMGPYGDYNTSLAIDPSNPNVVYAGGQTTFLRSATGGSSWSAIDTGFDAPHADHHGIGFDARGRLLDTNDGGIWRLDDPNTRRWADLNGDLNTIQVVGIALHPSNPDIIYGGAQDNFSEMFSDAYQWRALQGGDGGFARVDFNHPLTVYLTYQYTTGSGFLQRSDTGGTSLRGVTSGINTSDPGNFDAPFVLDPSNPSRLLLGTNRVYETINRGNNWAPISTPMAGGWTVRDVVDSVAAAGTDPNTVYATAGGHVFVTRDHGAHWMESNPTIPSPEIRFRDIRVDANDPSTAWVAAASFSDVTGGGHVWMTSDGGMSWNDLTSNLPDEPVWTIAVQPTAAGNILYVGAEDGVYGSADGGGSWDRMGQALPRVQVHQLEVNTNLGILAAATYGRGTWELALDPQSQTALQTSPTRASTLGREVAALVSATLTNGQIPLHQPTHLTLTNTLQDNLLGQLQHPSAGDADRLIAFSGPANELLVLSRATRKASVLTEVAWVDDLREEPWD
jgi:photosystem II stability/assembly factor-like uncharacterized protein